MVKILGALSLDDAKGVTRISQVDTNVWDLAAYISLEFNSLVDEFSVRSQRAARLENQCKFVKFVSCKCIVPLSSIVNNFLIFSMDTFSPL